MIMEKELCLSMIAIGILGVIFEFIGFTFNGTVLIIGGIFGLFLLWEHNNIKKWWKNR